MPNAESFYQMELILVGVAKQVTDYRFIESAAGVEVELAVL